MSKRPDPKPGVCRLCGCTETNACVDDHDRPCGWATPGRDLCSFCHDRGGPPEGYPSGDAQWRECVDLTDAFLMIESAKLYGLVEGGPRVDPCRCEELLRRGRALGHRPRAGSAERILAALAAGGGGS